MYPDKMYPDMMYPDKMYPDMIYPDKMYPGKIYPREIYPGWRDVPWVTSPQVWLVWKRVTLMEVLTRAIFLSIHTFWHGDNRSNKETIEQPGEPRASLLLTSEKAVGCKSTCICVKYTNTMNINSLVGQGRNFILFITYK